MATTKITDLTAYTDPVNTDVLPIVDVTSDVTKKVSIANVMKNASLGTAAAPGIAFDGDPNTGIYSPGANQVAITTDGTQRLLIDSAGAVTIAGDLTVNGTTTNINTQNLIVEDKNVVLGDVAVPTDVTADGGGITLKGTTDKTINWVDSTDAWTSSERFSYPTGSAAAPTLTFTGDPNTGIYSPGADQVAISTGGSGRLFVGSTGQVGIGLSPSYQLDVAGPFRFRAQGYLYDTAGTSQLIRFTELASRDARMDAFNGTDFNGTLRYAGANLIFETGTGASVSERARIDSSGRLGVGTSSPAALLHLSSGANTTLRLTDTAGSYSDIIYNESGTVSQLILDADPTGSSVATGGTSILLKTDGSTAMTIDSSQRVGIGTSSPSDILTVKQTVNGDNQITIYNDDTTAGSAAQTNSISFDFARTGSSGIQRSAAIILAGKEQEWDSTSASQDGYLAFYTTLNASSTTEKLRITSAGNVGIGTTSPGAKLQVETSADDDGITINSELVNRPKQLYFRYSNTGSGGAVKSDGPLTFWSGSGTPFERCRLDGSGRLLVGTSSTSLAATALLQGNSSVGTTGAGILKLARGEATPANGIIIGEVRFTDSGHTSAATFECQRDGGTWTSGTSQPTRLTFSTTADGASSPTERMRIANNGESYITSTGLCLGLSSVAAAGTTTPFIDGRYGATAGTPASGTQSFRVWTNGNVQNTNNSYTAISDIKLKENIVDANSQWADLKALRVRNYNLKEGQTHRQIGLIAQEVEPISPGLVYESPDRDEDGNDLGTVTKSVNYSVLYMKAVKALQEAMERIEVLEQRLSDAGIA